MRRRHPYRMLLGGILLTFALVIAIPPQSVGAPARVAALGALLVGALRTRNRFGRLGQPVLVLVVTLFVATLSASVLGSGQALTVVSQAASVVLVTAMGAILARDLLSHGEIDSATVDGVLCVYLLLALVFGSLNELFGTITPHYLTGAGTPPNSTDTLYFSVITLTTVGFGDITPASNLARAIAASEALIGQLYLVSVVATVVARFRPRPRDEK